ncbi:hypothetical protein [Desulfonema magnum]|uniref:Uncharacterized protein n=1 Tax=Desulfonema magnum TaxID=45655 RepID=A0A975BLA2_9BACT|nr:hypothetical protein [Desulfonema magnum]QTA87198.1 Uncharacterized protein dnm_032280 [Desulfonema magnum]
MAKKIIATKARRHKGTQRKLRILVLVPTLLVLVPTLCVSVIFRTALFCPEKAFIAMVLRPFSNHIPFNIGGLG